MTTDTAPTPVPAEGGRGARRAAAKADSGPNRLQRMSIYYREIIAELRKVIYPSRQQLLTYTVVVLFFVSFMTALVAGLDYGLTKAVVALFS